MAQIKTYDNNIGGNPTVIMKGGFTLNGASQVESATFAQGDTAAVVLVEQSGILGYRVTLRTGNSLYDLTLPGRNVYASIQFANGVATTTQADRLTNDLGGPPLGLPAINQFDVVVFQESAGVLTSVRTADVEVTWLIVGDQRPIRRP